MGLRRALSVAVVGLVLVPASAGAQAAPYVDWPSLLPALPVGHTPNTAADCADGSPACIDRTITEMYRRLNGVVGVCNHNAVFALAYLRVTEDVRTATRQGVYHDPIWLAQEDAVFARMYFETYDAWAAGRRDGLPGAWLLAFDDARERKLSGLGDFLMAMNAHINRDFPFMLEAVGITAADGTTHRPDHNVQNERLAGLYAPVLKEVADRFDPTADDIDVGPLDEAFAVGLLQYWRELVWRNAERLLVAPTPDARDLVAADIEAFAEGQGRLIATLFAASPAGRDAWCAMHGGQDPSAAAAAPAPAFTSAPAGAARLARGRLRLARAAVRVPLRCPAGSAGCRGTVTLTTRRGRTLARAAFALPAGPTARVALAVAPTARRTLARDHGRARVVLRRLGAATVRRDVIVRV